MPQTHVSFDVELNVKSTGSFGKCVFITNADLYEEIKKLGVTEVSPRKQTPSPGSATLGRLHVSELLGSVILSKVEVLLERAMGMKPSPHALVKSHERHLYFRRVIERTFSRRELDEARLFRMTLPPRSEIGYFKRQTEGEMFVVEADGRQRNKHQFGCLFPAHVCGFADPLKTQMELSGLEHLVFESILIEPVEKAIKPLWKLTSDLILPPNLLPLQQSDGEPFSGDLDKGCFYDEGGYWRESPHYRLEEIKRLGAFDVAVSSERIGARSNHAFRQLIVSQKFRQTMIKLGAKGGEYVPVTLV